MAALFVVPVPSSRSTVPTGYNYVLPDQNGWSRYLHFQSAWLGMRTAHFRTHLVPAEADRTWSALRESIGDHLRFDRRALGEPSQYNLLQRLWYLIVIFVLAPLMIWT